MSCKTKITKRNVPEFTPPNPKIIESTKKICDQISETDLKSIKIISPSFFENFHNYYIYEINFPKDSQLHQIKYNSFGYLDLYSLTLPPSLTIILPEALNKCYKLEHITFTKNDMNQSSLKFICDEAFKDTKIQSITIPESTKEIGSFCFPASLLSIEFENGAPNLKTVGDNAFSSTQIETIKIPSKTSLFVNSKNIFYKCKKLKTIIFDSFPSATDKSAHEITENERKSRKINFRGSIQKVDELSEISEDKAKSLLLSQTMIQKLEIVYSNLNNFYFFNTPNLVSIEIPKSDKTQFVKIEGCVYTKDKKKLIVAERNIKETVICSTCELISNYALNIKSLQKVSFEEKSELQEISFLAFYDSQIKDINLPSGTYLIQYGAFYKCKKLESINIPNSLSLIDFFTFSYTNLTKIVIPKNIVKIGFGSFLNCTNLNSVSFEKQSELIEIDDYAFACTKIESILIPKNVERIGNFCFLNCHQLKSINFEENSKINKIGSSCFINTQITEDNFLKILPKIDFSITKKNSDEKEKIFFMKTNLFESITQVFVPSKVERIGFHAFYDCLTLTKVEIIDFPNSKLKRISEGAFCNCTSLAEFEIPKSVYYFGKHSFKNCSKYNCKINIEKCKNVFVCKNAFENSGITLFNCNSENIKVFDSAFMNCANLNDFSINVTKSCKFGKSVFMNCSSLINVNLPKNVNKIKIGRSCFENSSIQKFIVPDQLKYISNSCFKLCKSLKEVLITDNSNLVYFGREAFNESGIEKVFIPSKTKIIRKSCFEKCKELNELNFSKTINGCILKENAFSMSGIESLALPDGIIEIGIGCFENCVKLKTVNFPNNASFKSIKENAFKSTGIEHLAFNQRIGIINKSAFQNCKNLKDILFLNKNTIKICSSSFKGCNQLKFVYYLSPIQIYDNIDDEYFIYVENNATNQNFISSFIINEESTLINQVFHFSDYAMTDKDFNFELKQLCDYKERKIEVAKYVNGAYYSKNQLIFCDFSINSLVIQKETKAIQSLRFSNLTKIEFETGCQIEKICKFSFENLQIEEISIPDSVTLIDDFAFSNCSKLKKVNISKKSRLKIIGNSAFERTAIEAILLPSSLSVVDDNAFYKCNQLKIVENYSSEINFGSHSFYHSSIEQINFPPNCFFSESSFKECFELKQLNFPKKSEKIEFGIESFSFSGIEYIKLDCDVKIEENAFSFCSNLKQVILRGNNVKCCSNSFDYTNVSVFVTNLQIEINDDCFDQKNHLLFIENKIVGSKVEKLSMNLTLINKEDSKRYNHQFYLNHNCFVVDDELINANLIDNLDLYIDDDDNNKQIKKNEILRVSSYAKKLNFQAIPHLKKNIWPQNCVVEELGNPNFFSYYNLIEIKIPKLVKKIPPYLFDHCHYLRSVSFEEGSLLTEIGEFSFSNTRIEKVNFPDSVQIIKQSAFSFTSDLKSVNFNGEIIEKEAFYESGITEFNLSNNTRIIESNAFQHCHHLKKFIIDIDNSNIEEINEYVFSETPITEINIPPKVKSIKKFAFSGCQFLKEVKFSSNSELKEIEEFSFSCNLLLEKINIPKTITKLSHQAFINTPSLLSIMTESNVNFHVMNDNVIYSKFDLNQELIFVPRNLRKLDIIKNCSAICSGAFCGSNLEEVSFLGNSVAIIEEMAFAHSTKLKKIVIPDSIKKIENEAFINCENLETVEFKRNCQLKEIPKFCFAFSGLKTINLPESIEIINDSSFYFCLNLKNVDLFSTNIKYIGDSAFSSTNIEQIVFPSTIQYIENHSFENTKSLNLVDFSHCYKIKNWNKFALMNNSYRNFIKMNKKIKSYSKIIRNSSFQFSKTSGIQNHSYFKNTALISKPTSPIIFKPFNTLTPKRDIFKSNKYDVKPPKAPKISHSPRHTIIYNSKSTSNFEDKRITTPLNLSIICYIHESSFANSSVKIFKFNHKNYKWFNFFDKCIQIERYFVNSNLCFLMKKKAIGNNNNNLLGSHYKVSKIFMENGELIPYKKDTSFSLSPFHFLNCFKLTQIILTDNIKIKTIPKCTFSFTNLREITIPSTVIRIEKSAFKYCHKLEKVTFLQNSRLKKIGHFAFYECYNLATISIPNGVKIIPFKCFSFSGLISIELSNSIEKVDKMAFFNCTKLSKIILNEGLFEICDFSFANNYSLNSIDLPDSLKIIKKYAFADCFNLRQVNTTENTKISEIHIGSFENTQIESLKLNPGIKQLTLSKGMLKLNQITFYEGDLVNFKQCDDGTIYENIIDKDKSDVVLNYYMEYLKELLLNDNILDNKNDLYNVSSHVLKNQQNVYKLSFVPKNLNSLKITENCISIGRFVFDGIKKLESIEFSGNCYLDNESKIINNSVKSIKMSNNQIHIEDDFFIYFESIEKVDFEILTTIYFIPKCCFTGKTKLTKIVIPSSCRLISEKAFKDCVNLKSIEINSIISLIIENEAFYNCSSLLNIDIPCIIKKIGKKAFMNCIKLKEFKIRTKNDQNYENENSFEIIEDFVFKNCKSLTSFRIPNSCQSIGKYSFMNCTNLTDVVYEGCSLKHIYVGAFCNCNSLKCFKVNLDRNLVKEFFVDEESFMNCTSLNEILFNSYKNEKVKVDYEYHKQAIPYRAFYNCKSLKKVRFFIGGLKEIHEDAFSNCYSLELLEINSKFKMNIHFRSFVNVSDSIVIKLFKKQKEVCSLDINDIKKIHKKGVRFFKEHLSCLNKSFLSYDRNGSDEKINFSMEPYLSQFIPRNVFIENKYHLFGPYDKINLMTSIGHKYKSGIFDDAKDYQTEYQYMPESRPPLNI